jgi:prepilin-type N-terminal cleavage/methylation domain-containing protein
MKARNGFTLIELVMVIALIAIVSTLAVGKIGDMRRIAARKVSIANQQAVGRAVETFLSLHDGRLDRLDWLMDAETPLSVRSSDDGFDYARTNKTAGAEGGLYMGPCRASGMSWPFPDSVTESNSGLAPELRALLVPYSLDTREVRALNALGLKFVMGHTVWADKSPRAAYRERGEDGAYLSDDATLGLVPGRSACVPAMVTNGLVVAAVSPVVNAGRDVYRDLGQALLRTEKDDSAYAAAGALAELKATGGVLLAFGLGAEASMIGVAQGGLDAAPYAEYLQRRYYRQYILLVRVNRWREGVLTAEFAGVLDPCGNTIRAARVPVK